MHSKIYLLLFSMTLPLFGYAQDCTDYHQYHCLYGDYSFFYSRQSKSALFRPGQTSDSIVLGLISFTATPPRVTVASSIGLVFIIESGNAFISATSFFRTSFCNRPAGSSSPQPVLLHKKIESLFGTNSIRILITFFFGFAFHTIRFHIHPPYVLKYFSILTSASQYLYLSPLGHKNVLLL